MNQETFDEICKYLNAMAGSFARGRTIEPEDLVQEGVVAVLQAARRYTDLDEQSLVKVSVRSARNRMLDTVRKYSRRPHEEGIDYDLPTRRNELGEVIGREWTMLLKLGLNRFQREVLSEMTAAECNQTAAAKALKVSKATICRNVVAIRERATELGLRPSRARTTL